VLDELVNFNGSPFSTIITLNGFVDNDPLDPSLYCLTRWYAILIPMSPPPAITTSASWVAVVVVVVCDDRDNRVDVDDANVRCSQGDRVKREELSRHLYDGFLLMLLPLMAEIMAEGCRLVRVLD
jgi:hypothetical protein